MGHGRATLLDYAEPPATGDVPLPPPAPRQPGGLVRRGATRRSRAPASEDKPLLVSIGYSRVPLVPRDGARVLRGRRDRGADERALRVRQGRPRGAPGRRRHLHGRRAGDDRPRRLAAERVHHRPTACRSTPAPTSRPSRARGCRAGRRCSAASATACREQRDEIEERRGAARRAAAGRRAPRRPRGRGRRRGCSTRPSRACARVYDPEHGGFGRRAEVPARVGDRVPARPRRARDVAAHAAGDGQRRHLRPGRRRVRALRGRPRVGRPALREDALRQRAARPRVPARLAGVRRRAVPAGGGRDARVDAARPAPGRGRVRLGAGRGLRGRRGQVLRVDARRAARGARRARRATAIAYFGTTEAGNFEGANILGARGSRTRPSWRRSRRRCSRRASGACGPGSTTSG